MERASKQSTDAPDTMPGRCKQSDWIEAALRREWWINHGHDFAALYGDDGEMQCGRCGADYKRDSLDRLRLIVRDARMERAALMSGSRDGREA